MWPFVLFLFFYLIFVFFSIRIQCDLIQKRQTSKRERSKMHLAFVVVVVVAFFISRLIVAHVNHCKTLHPHINCQQYFQCALFYNFSLIFSVIFWSCRFVLYYRTCEYASFSFMILFPFTVVMRLDLLWKRLWMQTDAKSFIISTTCLHSLVQKKNGIKNYRSFNLLYKQPTSNVHGTDRIMFSITFAVH